MLVRGKSGWVEMGDGEYAGEKGLEAGLYKTSLSLIWQTSLFGTGSNILRSDRSFNGFSTSWAKSMFMRRIKQGLQTLWLSRSGRRILASVGGGRIDESFWNEDWGGNVYVRDNTLVLEGWTEMTAELDDGYFLILFVLLLLNIYYLVFSTFFGVIAMINFRQIDCRRSPRPSHFSRTWCWWGKTQSPRSSRLLLGLEGGEVDVDEVLQNAFAVEKRIFFVTPIRHEIVELIAWKVWVAVCVSPLLYSEHVPNAISQWPTCCSETLRYSLVQVYSATSVHHICGSITDRSAV